MRLVLRKPSASVDLPNLAPRRATPSSFLPCPVTRSQTALACTQAAVTAIRPINRDEDGVRRNPRCAFLGLLVPLDFALLPPLSAIARPPRAATLSLISIMGASDSTGSSSGRALSVSVVSSTPTAPSVSLRPFPFAALQAKAPGIRPGTRYRHLILRRAKRQQRFSDIASAFRQAVSRRLQPVSYLPEYCRGSERG